ncbi:hypothetical protein FLONG3_7442 [Fusarium longipes]|uniref:Uncharacterized protein n=1 Tax=Fusarium longipes TaxID=694270 RepID=A0A395SDD3_9HYPO|nr:hypothetical protein FLONG3_7442 [Fusarium longipes]
MSTEAASTRQHSPDAGKLLKLGLALQDLVAMIDESKEEFDVRLACANPFLPSKTQYAPPNVRFRHANGLRPHVPAGETAAAA